MSTSPTTVLLAGDALQRTLRRMALSIVERTGKRAEELCLVGIRRGGVDVAKRLAEAIAELEEGTPHVGAVDISLYRDDAATALPDPKIGPSEIRFPIDGREVIVVDDVLQTGRTVRAAIDCVLDYGRPRRIWLAVLFDRGGRELPVHPDFVGKTVDVRPGTKLRVEIDGKDGDRAFLETAGDEESR
ncbi:MAG: bifunctional pyr operon transcriptional regulator/uracil phosphoribosyltransferase PyrR [Sandaracinaceae bacterium]|nr:bifunctional pyr operon transcriptional regulator/uracil phosphoribosyltransferase PyrR [Sandaracinaceae bacterium]